MEIMASGHRRLVDAHSRLYHINFANAETIVHLDVSALTMKSNCLSVSLEKMAQSWECQGCSIHKSIHNFIL